MAQCQNQSQTPANNRGKKSPPDAIAFAYLRTPPPPPSSSHCICCFLSSPQRMRLSSPGDQEVKRLEDVPVKGGRKSMGKPDFLLHSLYLYFVPLELVFPTLQKSPTGAFKPPPVPLNTPHPSAPHPPCSILLFPCFLSNHRAS